MLWTVHRLSERAEAKLWYLAIFLMADALMRSSFGTVSSPHMTILLFTEYITMSGLSVVGTSVIGKGIDPSKSTIIFQSFDSERRLERCFLDLVLNFWILPLFKKDVEICLTEL